MEELPSAQYMEYVYDNADRLTFSQDGNQRSTSKWIYYQYDGLSRLTQQGECVNKDTSSGITAHIQNYYDNYADFRSAIGNNSNYPDDASGNAKGSLTGSIITVLGGSTPICRAHYYDIKGRVTKTVENNLLGGYETTNFTYTFTDKPATTTHIHTATGKTTRTEIYTYTYDHADRLTTVKHRLNGTEVILAANAYDNFGRLASKSLHGSAANKLTYAYNIRSWVTGINGTNFNQNLYYNTGVGTASYNGNISSMTWKGNDGVIRGYKFSYDGLSRMQNATYGETAAINTNTNRFTENVTGYDKNGNITALQRYGQTGASAYGLIDNLTMTLSGNRLNRVDDAITATAYNSGFEFKNGANSTAEYAYDANGNLTKDLNKGITNIQYNVLNLPSSITFSDGSTVTYLYSADGTKLRTTHIISGTITTTDYCGSVIYENGNAKLLLTGEGYVSLNDNRYHYYLQDHQGNNRVVVNQSGTVEETNHYYPFGGVFASSASVQPYKYNGKEYDSKKGLNWHDYGARHYDAAVGRFMTVDPLAEKSYRWSPYTYCYDNPIKFVDPTGKYGETVWDVFSFTTGIKSFIDNAKAGNVGSAIVDGVGVVLDAAAIAFPLVPGGAGAGIKAARAVDKVADAVDAGSKVDKAADAIKTSDKAKDGLKIDISPENKINRDLLNPPSKHGNAPTSKIDKKPIEIHHEGQNPNGPFKEMNWQDHRGKGNYSKNHPNAGEPSKIDRTEFNDAKKEYWKKEYGQ